MTDESVEGPTLRHPKTQVGPLARFLHRGGSLPLRAYWPEGGHSPKPKMNTKPSKRAMALASVFEKTSQLSYQRLRRLDRLLSDGDFLRHLDERPQHKEGRVLRLLRDPVQR